MSMEESQAESSKSVNINMGNISQVTGPVNVAGGDITNYHVAEGGTLNVTVVSPEQASIKAVKGLAVLGELIHSSDDVSTAAVEFRTDFRATHEQVELLTHYKELHDQLHDLQFKCYNGLVDDAADFPTDERAVDRITTYAQDLKDIVKEMNRVASQPCMPKQELEWVQEISQTQATLSQALNDLDGSPLKGILWNMNRILMNQPARINSLLNQTARTLRLPELLKALEGISNTMQELDIDSEKVGIFRSGLTALGDLNRLLSLLVTDHHQWQMLEVELRQAGSSIEHGLMEFEMSWPYIKSKGDPLYLAVTEDWAVDLKKDCAILDEVAKTQNPAKVRSKFRAYQRGVSRHFYQVDKDLKSLCSELSKIGAPLTAILEMIS